MANSKTGFNYASMDTDRFQDIRIKRLKKEKGCEGFAVYEYVLNEIYRDKGCYLEWNDDVAFDVAEYWGLEEEKVKAVIEYCGSVGLFDDRLLSSNSILTSLSIQNRYIEMCTRAKRKEIIIPEEIRIITEESEIIREQSNNNPESFCNNTGSLTQSKVKESKVKESNIPPIIPPSEGKTWKDDFSIYQKELRAAYLVLRKDSEFLSTQERLNPRVDILLTLEKACVNFWGTEEGWMHKKKRKAKTINWKSTLTKSLSQPLNRVYRQDKQDKTPQKEIILPAI